MEEKPEERIRQISSKSAEYPQKLNNYPKMPEILFAKGNLPDAKKPTAAIVGARACSPYGRIQAFRYAKILSSAGVQIISGMAYGIDAEAHKGALEGGTPTYAVLAGGVDICYPSGNRPLYARILRENGGILSEQPPGMRARNYFFPARNRIISGLADLVLIVEAREKSGSLITAQWALDQGKIVYAVPGPVNEALSMGCHKLIYDGAGIAYSPEILLRELGFNCENKVKSPEKNDLGLASDLKLVYSCLDLRPKSTDFLIQKTGLPPEKIGSLLLELKLSGLVREIGRHYYIKET
ncbi:MAG: DNA-processing protein DprA [Blautia sp.]|uniref:DNA-processing protein DprA n=1 Tax=Blautia sp. CAG:237 TaxID=1262755 RepID=UPI00033F074F|nr:DNA-processing protein DprA [Blautia sp. CAG:237]MBN2947577.1 DNA-processing protein DprA [Blautia sp.]CDB76377.1 dNA protecting protein DprA [Blautia sp. CAG:237]